MERFESRFVSRRFRIAPPRPRHPREEPFSSRFFASLENDNEEKGVAKDLGRTEFLTLKYFEKIFDFFKFYDIIK